MLLKDLIAVLAVQSTLVEALDPYKVGTAVNTTSGLVVGHAASNATQVSEYLGIPFAQAPIGNLRFAPPVAYSGNRSIEASNFGADCPSIVSSVPYFFDLQLRSLLESLGQTHDTLNEDCLFLNVWSKPQPGSSQKPVLVWIYGGGFNSGGSSIDVYNGQYFADTEDVVVVSFNYRVNVFGFPGAPGITQNLGLLDQRLAVEWVRDNIVSCHKGSEHPLMFVGCIWRRPNSHNALRTKCWCSIGRSIQLCLDGRSNHCRYYHTVRHGFLIWQSTRFLC